MLVVHPASTCDVCLDGYTANSENAPHSIACGHIFCLSCLRCLRTRICPLCRQPFEERDIRRLHLDRTNLSPGSARHSPSPERPQAVELRDNILGLYEPLTSERLQQNIAEVVFGSITVDGVTERQVQDLLMEIRQFLYDEPSDKHAVLRASFILLSRQTRLQKERNDLESTIQRLRSENSRDRQTANDWERKYNDIKRSRDYDRQFASEVQERLNERFRFEEAEWQKKYDFIVEKCRALQVELDELRFTPKGRYGLPTPIKVTEPQPAQVYFAPIEDKTRYEKKVTSQYKDVDFHSKDDSYVNGVFRISPDAYPIKLVEEKTFAADDISAQKLKQRSPELPFMAILEQDKAWCGDRSRPGSSSSSISRASENVASANPPCPRQPALPTYSNRQRSGSTHTRSFSNEVTRLSKEKSPEVSLSAPSSYESPLRSSSAVHKVFSGTEGRARSATTAGESSSRPMDHTPEVSRLYALLEKELPATAQQLSSSFSVSPARKEGSPPPRPVLVRSSSSHQPRTSILSTPNAPLPVPPSNTTSRTVSESFVQTTPTGLPKLAETKRPMLAHITSLYSPSRTPASPQDNRAGSQPRRGSVSSASAAAAQQAGSRDGPPASHTSTSNSTPLTVTPTQSFVPPSTLRFSHFVPRTSWDYQDSD